MIFSLSKDSSSYSKRMNWESSPTSSSTRLSSPIRLTRIFFLLISQKCCSNNIFRIIAESTKEEESSCSKIWNTNYRTCKPIGLKLVRNKSKNAVSIPLTEDLLGYLDNINPWWIALNPKLVHSITSSIQVKSAITTSWRTWSAAWCRIKATRKRQVGSQSNHT